MADANSYTPSALLEQLLSEYGGSRGVTTNKRKMFQNAIIEALREIWVHAPWRWRLRSWDLVTTSTEAYVDLPSDYAAAYLPDPIYDTTDAAHKLYLRSRMQWTAIEAAFVDRSNDRPTLYTLSSRDNSGTETQTVKLVTTPDDAYTYRGIQYFAGAPTVTFGSIISFTGQAVDGDTITINGRVYEFDPENDGVGAGNQEIDTSASSTVEGDVAKTITDINADTSRIVDAFAYAGNKVELRLRDAYSYDELTVTDTEAGVNTNIDVATESAPAMPDIFGNLWHMAAKKRIVAALPKSSTAYSQAKNEYLDEMAQAESEYDLTIIEGAPRVHQSAYEDFVKMRSQQLTGGGREATWDGRIIMV